MSAATPDDLRARHAELRSSKLLLSAQLASLRTIPPVPPATPSSLSTVNETLSSTLRTLEEKCILYRSAAWTCFELDLDVGRRARSLRQKESKDEDLALGIRMDTFWRGRFYEPYYLIFARPGQLLETEHLEGDDLEEKGEGLKLIRHTVPHFVPLGRLVERYLPTVGAGEGSARGGDRAGGLSTLGQFQELPGVHAFLSDLHCHLQAYVSRRQQAMALQQLKLPEGETEAIEALGTEAFDLVRITCRIPSSSSQVDEGEEEEEGEGNPTAAALKAVAKRKRDLPDDSPTHHLEVLVQYDDLQSDRLVDETRPTFFSSNPEEGPTEVVGLKRPYGSVRVHLLEFAPEAETRQRRTPGISRADLKALRPEITRREDLEQLYAREEDGESMDMDEAFERVVKRVWGQLRGKTSTECAVSWFSQQRRIRRLLKPRRDPMMYQKQTPDFRSLAKAYPETFGKFVKDDGGYEAKLDFQDAAAVRCLAETLLLADFGLNTTFSATNLCPTIPNRLAYISIIHQLLSWTLPTSHLLHFLQQKPEEVGVRGLDLGTGASAIYPLLGSACFDHWGWVGTDIDSSSLAYAREHVLDRNTTVAPRINLVHVNEFSPFIPSGGEFEFSLCNPPFYSSSEEMQQSAAAKRAPPNAVCHGTHGEMVTQGGEVEFVRRMIGESLNGGGVRWWTCMLGKLSSLSILAGELKVLAKEGKVGGWGLTPLPTGGGRTKRWVLLWTATAFRLCDNLSRTKLPHSLERSLPPSTRRSSKLIQPGPKWTRKEVYECATGILGDLDGCEVFPSAQGEGVMDVVLRKEGWTRRARRAKLRGEATEYAGKEPLLMARMTVEEEQKEGVSGGLRLKVSWIFGKEAIKFESFAMFLIHAVERSIDASIAGES